MRLYRFDTDDAEAAEPQLILVPLAARRALDVSGVKLSLEAWRALPLDARRRLVELGSADAVDGEAVLRVTAGADPEPRRVEPRRDPPADRVPDLVGSAYQTHGGVPASLWATLPAVDRYALAKVAGRGKPDRVAAAHDEIVGHGTASTHLDPKGAVRMIDVGKKGVSERRAVAESRVTLNEDAFSRLTRAEVPKGNVLATARIAGIMAAKRTSELVPLCHPLRLTKVEVDLEPASDERAVLIRATVECAERTGVEMEALTAASVAALTVYDMLKAFDRSMKIGPTRLLAKSGGRSGDFRADD